MSVLPTLSDLPIASPLAADMTSDSTEQMVRLGEICGRTLLHVRGAEAEHVLGASSLAIGDAAAVENEEGLLARLRRDEFVLLVRDGWATSERLAGLIGEARVTLTDITHGRCGLLLVGAGTYASDVLRKVCGLDFADAAFPSLHAAQTSLAKVRTLIIRADIDTTPAYGLFLDRSLAQYVWDVVYDAGLEFGIRRIDLDNTRARGLW
jgi:heterotetrameric sarcosine oxidase gamma subunit